ncbi:MAG: ATP-binding protein [Phycisphaerae bacterium]|nr:ATP-binding protein [Phycisphaerae bacterium]
MGKERSPFSPGRPVPVEFFVGRRAEIGLVLRSAGQVAAGKQENVFVTGEYGIGKSSLAAYVRFVAEKEHRLAGFQVFLGGATTVEEMVEHVISRIVDQAYQQTTLDKVKGFLGKYVEELTIFGAKVNLAAVRADAPGIARNFLPFLRQLYEHLRADWKGLLLILDDLNGITASPAFAALLKSLVDEIATSGRPLPLLLVLTGVPERRDEILHHQRPVERIFEIVEIEPLSDAETQEFIRRAFASVDMTVEPEALGMLAQYSGGLPKLVHELGDAAFWAASGPVVSAQDAHRAVAIAVESVGRKYFDPVRRALRSSDYHSILRKLGTLGADEVRFRRADVFKGLTQSERGKLDNFLQRMKKLDALHPGDTQGEWVFPNRLIKLYLYLESTTVGSGERNAV